MKEKHNLVKLIKKDVVEPYRSSLLNQIKPSIRLKTNGKPCHEVGRTKLGGCPDLSKMNSWARSKFDNQYLSFLGQINLKDVKQFDEFNLLPQNGILYFFFNLESVDDGKVIFSIEENELERAILPDELKEQKKSLWKRILTGKSKKRVLKESQVEIYKEYTFPSWDSLKLEQIQREAKTHIKPIDAYKEGIFEECYEEEETETTSNHHLIGYYNGIQSEFYELNFIDFEIGDFQNMTMNEIEKALKWKLLFQFDSDDNLEISWGDWGRIYFFIDEDDLKNGNFDNVKISADCY